MISSNYKKTRNELEENNIQKLFFGTKEQSAMKTHASKLIFFCSVWRTTEKKKTTISEMLLYILHKKKGIRNEVYVESYDSECLSFNAIYISEKNIGVIPN